MRRSVQLYTRDGVLLSQICSRDSWVWCVRPRPKHNFVGIGCENGMLACYQLIFSTVGVMSARPQPRLL